MKMRLLLLVFPSIAVAFVGRGAARPIIGRQTAIDRPSGRRLAAMAAEDVFELPNDFRTFLNQCTIQSFMFLLGSVRDLYTAKWVEEFSKPTIVRGVWDQMNDLDNWATGEFKMEDEEAANKKKAKLLQYHGLAALNTTLFPTWEDYFKILVMQEEAGMVIETKAAHIPNYELDIIPSSLCTRMISVREQIAKEWVHDLAVIERMGGYTIESYWRALEEARDYGSNPDIKIAKQNLLFLDFDPSFNGDSDEEAYKPSPLRKGNFDLLVLLTTQEAIHQILNEADRHDGASRVSHEFLKRFYKERIRSHFSGVQRYGRADDFLQDLLSATPSVVNVEKDVNYLVDPMGLAESILIKREHVAREWRDIAKATAKGEEHFNVRRMALNVRMGLSPVPQQEESSSSFQ